MSAKTPPVARRSLTNEQLRAFAAKLQGNGLPEGTPVYWVETWREIEHARRDEGSSDAGDGCD